MVVELTGKRFAIVDVAIAVAFFFTSILFWTGAATVASVLAELLGISTTRLLSPIAANLSAAARSNELAAIDVAIQMLVFDIPEVTIGLSVLLLILFSQLKVSLHFAFAMLFAYPIAVTDQILTSSHVEVLGVSKTELAIVGGILSLLYSVLLGLVVYIVTGCIGIRTRGVATSRVATTITYPIICLIGTASRFYPQ